MHHSYGVYYIFANTSANPTCSPTLPQTDPTEPVPQAKN